MKDGEIYFYRWGNLNPVKHKEARKNYLEDCEWSHTAPCVKGIYAFPRGFVERFLIGGSYTTKTQVKLFTDENGQPIKSDDFWAWDTDDALDKHGNMNVRPQYQKLLKKLHIRKKDVITIDVPTGEVDEDGDPIKNHYAGYYKRPKKFTYTGPIWHHLKEVTPKKEIIAESGSWIKTSFKSYVKALHKQDTKERFDSYIQYYRGKTSGDPHTFINCFCKDWYEVFIERI